MNEAVRRRDTSIPPASTADFKYVAHYLADDFDMIKGREFDDLVADIKENGIHYPITLYDDGSGLKILDGRNRYAAATAAGHKFVASNFKTFTGSLQEAEAYVNSVNNKRRHQSSKQIEAYIQKVIQRYPKASNREIERITGHSHVTVGKARQKLTNPYKKEREDMEKFKKTFDQKWPHEVKLEFVKHFENDIREMLGL
jgi:hypothetical protein